MTRFLASWSLMCARLDLSCYLIIRSYDAGKHDFVSSSLIIVNYFWKFQFMRKIFYINPGLAEVIMIKVVSADQMIEACRGQILEIYDQGK